ncbi:hypothetical protein M514_12846 [Trichuris suis]|uniref:Uncharacterized protein n=1 Tax=Trichuris suis TaxID=68888 RepID=A0A085LMT9_9BILA|nr:hypothetical protein M513_12846 [Trichuris suis]KFD60263.1 hypothetical protein M514_12846 [Trichuris suis]
MTGLNFDPSISDIPTLLILLPAKPADLIDAVLVKTIYGHSMSKCQMWVANFVKVHAFLELPSSSDAAKLYLYGILF